MPHRRVLFCSHFFWVRQLLFARDVPLKTFCRVVDPLHLLALYMEQYDAGDEVVLAWWRSRTAPVGLQHPGDDHEAVIAEFLGSLHGRGQ